MTEKEKKSISKFLSYILRHNPQQLGLELRDGGWVRVDKLLAAMRSTGSAMTIDDLKEIVTTNAKQRFAFNEDLSEIRANQGHSLDVDLALEARQPPSELYHGTASIHLHSIRENGILKMNRHHVHLSADRETARQVGTRHGKAVVLIIEAEKMWQEGSLFLLSNNGVWLTEVVPARFIKAMPDTDTL